MLVYSTTLWLASPTDIDRILQIIGQWLSRKARESIIPTSLKLNQSQRMHDGSWIETIRSDTSFPIVQAIRYTHADMEVSGRQWITEIGLRQESNNIDIECSILLRTSEISARVSTKIQVTRPLVVLDILEQCKPSMKTCGLSIKTLNDESAEAFRYVVTDQQRRHPLIVVSPTTSSNYLVDISRLSSLVVGLADVIKIPPDADTFYSERVIGEPYAAWRGAINLIFPEVNSAGKRYIPTKRLIPDELSEMISAGLQTENEILSMITHRTNLPHSWRHISPESVSELNLRRELARRREEVSRTGETTEYISLLEEANNEQTNKIAQLEEEVRSLENEFSQHEEDIRQKNYTIESLKTSLSQANVSKTEPAISGLPDRIRDALLAAINQSTSPYQALLALTTLFPDRVTVLDGAWKSADKSKTFKYREPLFDLLEKLVTTYWESLASGKSDSEARTVFGTSYSAKESETVEKNARARMLRIFDCEGRKVER